MKTAFDFWIRVMRAMLSCAGLFLICGLVPGCDDGDSDPSPPPIREGETQVWYGRVNTWAAAGLDVLRADVAACADSGVTGYMIELETWGDSTMGTDKEVPAATAEAYRNLVGWCRKEGLWLFVSVGNDNAGSGGYGDRGVPLSKVTERLEKLVELIRSRGSRNVIVQPCAETRTAAGMWIENLCVERLAGFPLAYNGNSGRPGNVPSWASFRAYHPLLGQVFPPDALIISDSGDLIRALSTDGSLGGPGDPDKLRAWVGMVKAAGAPVAGYYAFQHAGHDAPAIQALGQGLRL